MQGKTNHSVRELHKNQKHTHPVVWVAALLPQAVLPRHWQGCALGLLLLLRLRHWPLKQLEVLQEALTLLALPLPGQDEQGRLHVQGCLHDHAQGTHTECDLAAIHAGSARIGNKGTVRHARCSTMHTHCAATASITAART
eukprot:scaffold204133_cov22-Tisochrysis_lutea.AAC.2